MNTHTLTGGEARCEVDELLHELAEAELGKQVTVTGAAVKIHRQLTSWTTADTFHKYSTLQSQMTLNCPLLNLINCT